MYLVQGHSWLVYKFVELAKLKIYRGSTDAYKILVPETLHVDPIFKYDVVAGKKKGGKEWANWPKT